MLFSATMPPGITKLILANLHDPVRIEISPAGGNNEQIQQELCYVEPQRKPELLQRLLPENPGTILVFSRTKHGARKLTKQVLDMGHAAAEIHSNQTLSQRRHALDGFKCRSAIACSWLQISPRGGLMCKNIAMVVNYDLPETTRMTMYTVLAAQAALAKWGWPSLLPHTISTTISRPLSAPSIAPCRSSHSDAPKRFESHGAPRRAGAVLGWQPRQAAFTVSQSKGSRVAPSYW